MRFNNIVYLDPSLIAELYTELEGVSPVTSISKGQDLDGGVAAGLFHLGGTVRETREFEVSTTQMFLKIEHKLREFSVLGATEALSTDSFFWIDGILAVGMRTLHKNGEPERDLGLFTIANSECQMDKYLDLAAKDDYFTSGYDRMAAEKEMLGHLLWQPVQALLRPAFCNGVEKLFMFTPVVMLRK